MTLEASLTSRSHESVNLVRPPLHDILDLDSLGPLLDVLLWLVLGRKHGERDGDAWGVVLVDHGRVAGCGGFEGGAGLGGKVDDFAAPAAGRGQSVKYPSE